MSISSTLSSCSSPRVLLVEDHPFLQQITSKQLDSCGCHVQVASDAKAALSFNLKLYDLIFLDIGLPDIDGITLCRMIRQHEKKKKWQAREIIFFTTCSDKIEEALAAGANAYYEKPVASETIKKIISQWRQNQGSLFISQ